MKLTAKQKKFCIEYVKLGNATQASINAGYSKKTAKQIGTENLSKLSIKEYIAELMKPKIEQEKKDIADIQEVLSFFTKVMRGEEKDQFDLDAALQDRIKAGQELARRYEKTNIKDEKDEGVTIINDV